MPLKILPLGINGYMPSYGRGTMSILVISPPNALLFDAGTGIVRFLDENLEKLLSQCTNLHIFLSHYHLDHVIGLFFLPGIWSRWPVQIYAPAKPFVGVNPHDAIRNLLEPPLSSDFEPPPIDEFFTIHSIQEDILSVGGLEISIRLQDHPGGSLAFRVGNEFVYATDTKPNPETAVFAKGIKFLLHDIYLGDQSVPIDSAELQAHSSLHSAIELAMAADAKILVPIHLNPKWSPEVISHLQQSISTHGIIILWPQEGEELLEPSGRLQSHAA